MSGPDTPRLASSLYPTVAAAVIASLPVFLVGALAVQLTADLEFDPGALGAAISLYFLGAAVSSVPMSRLAERIGALRIMKLSCALIGVLFLVMAMITSWAGLVAAVIPAGIANGALQPSINQYISRRVPRHRQGLVFGIKQSSIPFCALIGGVSVPAIALTVGWRWVFIAAAVAAVAAGLALPRPDPGRRLRARGEALTRQRSIGLAVLTIGFALGLSAANALTGFLVIASVSSGVDEALAGLLLAFGSVTAIVARVALGWWVDHREVRILVAVAALLALGGAGFTLLALVAEFGTALVMIPAVILAFACGWGWNGLFNLATIRHFPSRPAFSTGVVQTGGRVGGFLGPLLFGLAATTVSYTLAYLAGAAVLVVAAVVTMIGRHLLQASEPVGEPG